MRKFNQNNIGSVIPLLLFIVSIVVVGALYTLFFIEIGFPLVNSSIPVSSSSSKTFIMAGMYGLPFIVLIVGIVSLFLSGLKRGWIG